MALYEFDDKNIYDSWAIDKNGYHKHPYEGGSVSGSVFEENVFVLVMNNSQSFATCFVNLDEREEFKDSNNIQSVYLYFGDTIDDNQFVIDSSDADAITNINELGLTEHNFFIGNSIFPGNMLSCCYSFNPYPENWKNLQAHMVFLLSGSSVNENSNYIVQIHQKK